jgi:hypothetical protein
MQTEMVSEMTNAYKTLNFGILPAAGIFAVIIDDAITLLTFIKLIQDVRDAR